MSAGRLLVRRLAEEDWALLRALRLAMLLDAPQAYSGTFEQTADLPEEAWRARTANATFVVTAADRPGLPLGTTTLLTSPDADPEVVGMWVAAHARGSGAGDALVQACVDAARAAGADRLQLHVMAENQTARRLYQRFGFRDTGVCGDVPGCEQMLLPVSGSPDAG